MSTLKNQIYQLFRLLSLPILLLVWLIKGMRVLLKPVVGPLKKAARTTRGIFAIVAGVTLLAVLPVVIWQLRSPFSQPEASWFDADYGYRQRVDITGISSSQTDYQVKTTLDTATLITAGKIQADCDDIRVTDVNGKVLPYWIETGTNACNTATTAIWAKVPSVPTTGATIYIYYGNATAIDAKNGKQTFEFFDDFSGSTLDPSVWTATGATSVSAGELLITTGAVYTNNTVTASSQNRVFEMRAKWAASATSYAGINVNSSQNGSASNSDLDALAYLMSNSNVSITQQGFAADGTLVSYNVTSGTTQYTPTADTYYISGISYDATTLKYYQDRTQTNSYSTTVGYVPYLYFGHYFGSAATTINGTDLTIDFAIVRKFATTEPTATLASEEMTPGPAAYLAMNEGLGQTVNDSTERNFDGTLGANGSVAADDPVWQNEEMCVSGKCLDFNGTEDIVQLSALNPPVTTTGTYSISLWFYTTKNTSTQPIINFRNSSTDRNGIVINTTSIQGGYYNGAYTGKSGTIETNRWNHVELVNNAGTVTMYLNGRALTGTSMGNLGGGAADNLIGSNSNVATFFQGRIDEVKIYPYARSAAQNLVDFNEGAAQLGIPQQSNLSSGQVGYWKMDEESGNASDSSGNSTTLTNTNTATFTGGKFFHATDLESGSSQYFSAADNAPLSLTGAVTIAAWIKPESVTAATHFDVAGKWDGANESYLLAQYGTQFRFYIDSASNYVETTNAALAVNTWYHIVATYDPVTQTAQVFKNGVLLTTTTTGTIPTSIADDTSNFQVGAEDSSTTAANFFDGLVDEVRIYNRTFSGSDAINLFAWAPGPVGYWKMDENTGTTAFDSSGNNFNGTLTGSPVYSPGVFSGGIATTIDSVRQWVSVDDTDALDFSNVEDFTVATWYRMTAAEGTVNLVSKGGVGNTTIGYDLRIITSFTVASCLHTDGDGAGNESAVSSATDFTLNDGKWHHVVCVMDRDGHEAGTGTAGWRIYVDGKFAGSDTSITETSAEANTAPLNIGEDNGAREYTGGVDETKIYNYARTPAQILEDMNAGGPVASVSPIGSQVAYWALDEQSGTTARSRVTQSSYNVNGTISGATWKLEADCKINGCLDFDGTDDVVTVTNVQPVDFNTGLLAGSTFAAWVYADSAGEGSGGQIFYKGGNHYLRVDTLSGGRLDVEAGNDYATTDPTLNISSAIAVGTWNHVAASFDERAKTITIYINGVARGTSTAGVGAQATDTADLLIGGNTTDNFDGKIDEAKVYQVPMTAQQIALEMNAGSSVSYGVMGAPQSTTVIDGVGNPPVGEWQLDENTGTSTADTSGNGNTGTLTAGPTWGPGKMGAAVTFDALDDHIDAGAGLGLTGDLTLESWFKTTSTANSSIITKGANNDWLYSVFKDTSQDIVCKLYQADSGTAYLSVVAAGTYNDGLWHQVTCTVSSTTMVVYIDGIAINSSSSVAGSRDVATAGNFYIGQFPNAGSTFYATGSLDQTRVYDYARAPAQVAYDYNRGKPLAWWKFDDCQGPIANDSSGNSNNATLVIGATGSQTSAGTCSTSGTAWGNGASGKYNSSLNFDGTDDTATFSRSSSIRSIASQGSISYWVNYSVLDTTTHRTAIDIAGTGVNGLILFVNSTTSTKPQVFYGTGAGVTTATATSTFTTGTWYHIVGTWDSSGVRIYVNGALEATSATAPAITIGAGTSYIGSNGGSQRFVGGKLDDMMVFNYVLTQAQINQVYNEQSSVRFGPATGSP